VAEAQKRAPAIHMLFCAQGHEHYSHMMSVRHKRDHRGKEAPDTLHFDKTPGVCSNINHQIAFTWNRAVGQWPATLTQNSLDHHKTIKARGIPSVGKRAVPGCDPSWGRNLGSGLLCEKRPARWPGAYPL